MSLDPLSRSVVELGVPVSAMGGRETGAPYERTWAFQLAGGQACVLVNAAWDGLGPFSCSSSSPSSIPNCHVPKRASPWWSVQCATVKGAPFSTHRVIRVWS